jgi:hypothetical protein
VYDWFTEGSGTQDSNGVRDSWMSWPECPLTQSPQHNDRPNHEAPGTAWISRASVVAGACYARDSTLPVPLLLPVEGRVSPRAAAL